MAPLPDAQTVAADWAAGLAAKTDKINRGIDNVSVAPGQKAAAKKDKYVAGVVASQDNWARNVAGVGLAEWQSAAKAGVSRIAEGARLKQGKFADRMVPVLAHMQTVKAAVDAMPDNTLEQRIAKSREFQLRMAAFKQRGR